MNGCLIYRRSVSKRVLDDQGPVLYRLWLRVSYTYQKVTDRVGMRPIEADRSDADPVVIAILAFSHGRVITSRNRAICASNNTNESETAPLQLAFQLPPSPLSPFLPAYLLPLSIWVFPAHLLAASAYRPPLSLCLPPGPYLSPCLSLVPCMPLCLFPLPPCLSLFLIHIFLPVSLPSDPTHLRS